MAQAVAIPQPSSRAPRQEDIAKAARLKALVVPREHGAWGLLLIPLLVGGAVGLRLDGRVQPVLLLLGAALALFWLRAPVESLLGAGPMRVSSDEERRYALRVIAAATAVALLFLGSLFRCSNVPALLTLGAAAALAFVAQAFLKRLGRSTRMASQIVGALGLTVTAPAAYFVSTAHLDARALGLWLASFLFSAHQIYFVHLRIHGAKLVGLQKKIRQGWGFAITQALFLVALGLAVRRELLPVLSLLAFAPAICRGTAWFFRAPQALNVKKIGWNEVLQSLAFGLLLSGVYWI